MAAAFIYHNRQNGFCRPCLFPERVNPILFLCDAELIDRYRFPRAGIEEIIETVRADVSPSTERSHALDVTTKVSTGPQSDYAFRCYFWGNRLFNMDLTLPQYCTNSRVTCMDTSINSFEKPGRNIDTVSEEKIVSY